MADPVYHYTVHDLVTNVQIGELPLSGVSFSKRLNDSGQLQGSFTVEDRFAARRVCQDPYDATMPGRRVVYAWRDEIPQWGGVIWTRSYDSGSRTVSIGAGDWWSYFDHRKVVPLLGLPVDPEFEVAEMLVEYTGVDQNDIVRALITLAQSHTGGDLNIEMDTEDSLITRDQTYRGYELVNLGEALRQLTELVDGPDMIFDVSRDVDLQGRPKRVLRLGAPHLGQQGSAWVWELGGNLMGYSWPSDATRYHSRTYALGEGTVEGTMIAVSEDTTVYDLSFPLTEQEESYGTVDDPDVLQSHADADQTAGRRPVVLPVLIVKGDRSPMVGEWSMGDDARVIITDDFHPYGCDTTLRIVGADISPPDAGSPERVELTMAPVLEDVV